MTNIRELLDAHPRDTSELDRADLTECIEACYACVQACTACADACLAEDMVAELTTCIRTDLDCADICATTGAVLSRQTGSDLNLIKALLEICRLACSNCAAECESHAGMHDHCRICGETCRRCEAACKRLLASLN